MRPLEASARKKGVKFLLNYHMDVIFRERPNSGRVLGIQASYAPTILPGTTTPFKSFRSEGNIDMSAKTVTVRAKKAVIIGTGGSTGNVNFRRIFDVRLTEEFPLAAEEYSPQDASGELAAMAIGATLWGTANQTFDRNGTLRKRPIIGTRTNYIGWTKNSPIFPKVGPRASACATGRTRSSSTRWASDFTMRCKTAIPTGRTRGSSIRIMPGDWRNATKIKYAPMNYVDAAMAINEGSTAPDFAPGPQWAIFDAEAVKTGKVESGRRPPRIPTTSSLPTR